MIFSLSTLNWLTFPLPPRQPVPFSSSPLEEVLDAAVSQGFSAVGLDSVALGESMLTASGCRRVATAVAERGLVCTDIGVLRVGRSDGLEAARALASLARSLSAVAPGGLVPCCGLVVDAPVTAAVVAEVRGVADILWASGCRLAVEFMAFGAFDDLAQAIELCEAVGWQRAGLLLDSWHVMQSRTSWAEVAALGASRIALVQVSDGLALAADADEFFAASRWGRRPPGAGTLELHSFVEAVRATGYDGVASAEILSFAATAGSAEGAARVIRESLEQTFGVAG